MHLCVAYFVTVNRANYHGNVWRWFDFRFTFAHVERPKSTRQVVFSLFSRWITNLVTHRKRKHTNTILNEDAEAFNQPVNIEINGSDCLCTDTWWQKNMHILCAITRDGCSLHVSCMCAVGNKCVLLWTIFVVCDNLCKQFGPRSGRPDKKSGLIWIRTVWHSFLHGIWTKGWGWIQNYMTLW